jgi:hypothetical protein
MKQDIAFAALLAAVTLHAAHLAEINQSASATPLSPRPAKYVREGAFRGSRPGGIQY